MLCTESDRYTQVKSQKSKVKSKNLTRFSYSSVLALLHESRVLNIHSAPILLCFAIIDVLLIYCPIVIALHRKRSLYTSQKSKVKS
ncbi:MULTISPECIES: hypothetical protein [Okeania]|uniref:hypothetical protein n=1 Tax=Okeania TaxID=1458928 RepID=UPI000F520D46|nr:MULTISPECIES: hypothetical protein [Okeania]NET97414.1 hypothetical protein [Okeania sp. SIO1H2]